MEKKDDILMITYADTLPITLKAKRNFRNE